MKGLKVERGGRLSVCELPKPAYGEYQALVKTISCGVCNGTDMKLIHGSFKNMEEYPMLLGHESVGRVVEKGAKAVNLNIGDLVLLPFLYEGAAGCSSGWGSYCEYAVVGDGKALAAAGFAAGSEAFDLSYTAQTVIKPEDGLDAKGAAMVVTFREVLSAIKRFGFKENESAVVFGAGPVGLCFVKFAKLLGLSPVIALDIYDEKLEAAKAMGADFVINSKTADVTAEIKKILPQGADYAVDAVGLTSLINTALGLVKYNGKVCVYGISPETKAEINWTDAPYNWNLHFVQFPLKNEEAAAHNRIIAWIKAGALNPDDFISHTFKFEDILRAFELVEERRSDTKKIVILYE